MNSHPWLFGKFAQKGPWFFFAGFNSVVSSASVVLRFGNKGEFTRLLNESMVDCPSALLENKELEPLFTLCFACANSF